MKKIYSLGLAVLGSVAPLAALAQSGGGNVPPYEPVNPSTLAGISQVLNFIVRIANYFGMVLMGISVIMILYAAFKFITANGDATAISTARTTLIWALIGVAVALLAFALPAFVKPLLTS